MRILIVGNGNIGTLYGFALTEAGHDARHLIRPGKLVAQPSIAQLDLLDERGDREVHRVVPYPWRLTDRADDPVDIVLVASRASAAIETVAAIAPHQPDATFVVWALAWDGLAALAHVIDPARIVLGYPDSGGTRDDAGHYVLALGAEPHLGPAVGAGPTDTSAIEQVASVLRTAGLEPIPHPDMAGWLRVHAAMTVPYWAALARDRDLAAMLRDGRLLRQAFRAQNEALAVCAASGIDLGGYPEVDMVRMPAVLFPFAFRWLFRRNESMRRVTAHGIDGLAEARPLYAAMLAEAERRAVPAPNLRALGRWLEVAAPDASGAVAPRSA